MITMPIGVITMDRSGRLRWAVFRTLVAKPWSSLEVSARFNFGEMFQSSGYFLRSGKRKKDPAQSEGPNLDALFSEDGDDRGNAREFVSQAPDRRVRHRR